jgi:signal transduction histidine kinase
MPSATLLTLYHSFNRFLGTYDGEFFKKSIELVVLAIITYMIASEYMRERESRLKYLVFAFGTLAIEKFLSVGFLFFYLFGSGNMIPPEVSILLSIFEIAALLFIANAFAYPVLPKQARFLKKVKTEIAIPLFILIIAVLTLIFLVPANAYLFHNSITYGHVFIALESFKIVVLTYAIIIILFRMEKKEKYKSTVFLAFFLYLLTPLFTLLSLLMDSQIYRVISYPFPLLSILLFTRAVYVKLVDKAYLKEQVAEARLKYLEERELSKLKDEFVSTVSHELKTPLTSMRLYLSLLEQEKQGKLTDDQKKTLAIIHAESRRLSSLIDDILDLSRLEHNKVKLKSEEVPLHELVTTSVHRNLAERKNIVLTVDIPEDMRVVVDPDRFKQVLINLYSNAIKFTDTGGKIQIKARTLAKTWELSVMDNGCGIPQDKQRRLFTKFFQAENYLTRQVGGTGLGLAIAKHIVDLHHGKISVHSRVNHGTTFTVSIPKTAVSRR